MADQATLAPERLGWTSSPDGRGTIDILWTCLFTVFICTWTVVHPDVPKAGTGWFASTWDRTICLAWAVIAPEVVVYLAMSEYLQTFLETRRLSKERSMGPKWTATHTFYAGMGGFSVVVDDTMDRKPVRYALGTYSVELLYREGRISWKDIPSQKEIDDKGKADGFIKFLTLAQGLWFIIQTIGRASQKLPITTLEISTSAYIPGLLLTSFLWWHKPYNVSEPTVLNVGEVPSGGLIPFPGRPGSAAPYFEYSRSPMTKDCIRAIRSTLVPMSTANTLSILFFLVFGGIHCAAWNFSFPSPTESLLWRICSVIMATSLPVTWAVTRLFLEVYNALVWRKWIPEVSESTVESAVEKVHGMGLVVYALVRVYLLVDAFAGLRSLPAACYVSVDWNQFLPHLG